MRWLLPIIAFALTLGAASAQRPWSDYDSRQRATVLASPKVPVEVRSSVGRLNELSATEREQLWGIVTTPTRNKHLRSLYLYIYEVLRPMDGSAASEDMAMLVQHPAYLFKRWSNPLHSYDVYNYAYAIGKHGATSKLRKVCKRRYMRRYGAVVTALSEGAAMAEASARLDCTPHYDDMAVAVAVCAPREIAIGEYNSVDSTVEPLAAPRLTDNLEQHIASEFIAWDGCYNRAVDHNYTETLSIVASMSSCGTIFSLHDACGDHLMLADELYLLSAGELFVVTGGEVIFGCIDDGGMHVVGRVAMDGGELAGVKCTEEGLYVKLHSGDTTRCYMLSVGDYERY